ncbi:MAG: tycC 2 [Microbacteriaceae bacterium]|nr:tycC 2 [Microbacteriaceae bacterium]
MCCASKDPAHGIADWTMEDELGVVNLPDFETRVSAWKRHVSSTTKPGDRVLLKLHSGVDLAAAILGTARSGRVAVPLAPMGGAQTFEHVLRDCEPNLVVTDRIDIHEGDATQDWTKECEPSDPFMIIYTSGSTGAPKGVVSTHANVHFTTAAIQRSLGYRTSDVILSALAMHFSYGLYQIFLSLVSGAHLIVARSWDRQTVQRIDERRVTILPLTPYSIDSVMRRSAIAARNDVRLITTAAAALSASQHLALEQAFPGSEVRPMYGMTECARITIAPSDAATPHYDSVGVPLDGTTLRIMHGDLECPTGEVGEIVASGPHVAAYWGHAANEPPFGEQSGTRSVRTGDLGWLDQDGCLHVAGRTDDVFKLNGMRTSVGEIEAAANSAEGVTTAAVLRPTPQMRATLVYVGTATERDVRQHVERQLGIAKAPPIVRRVGSLPLIGNGKVDRRRLSELLHTPDARQK